MVSTKRDPAVPDQQPSTPQTPIRKNDESSLRRPNSQEGSNRRFAKDGNTRRSARKRRGNRLSQELDSDSPQEDLRDETEDGSSQSVYQLRLALFKEVERREFDWASEISESRVRNLLHGSENDPETLLHQMVEYLRQLQAPASMNANVAIDGTSSMKADPIRELEKLAKFALTLEPGLLKEKMLRTDLTPLQCALEKKSSTLEKFAEFLCEVAANSDVPGSKMNACQEAIHVKKDGQTALHFAISQRLYISRFLVQQASDATLLEGSGPNSNTPLHEAVDFAHLGQRKWWPKLVEMLVDENPRTILQLNNKGHSPYRYHLITTEAQNSKNGKTEVGEVNGIKAGAKDEGSVNDKNSSVKAASPTKGKEEANGNSKSSDPKGQIDMKSKANAETAKKPSEVRAEQQKQADYIQELLLEECLRIGGHKEAFTGLWGSFDGNPRTWLNLLVHDVELSESFDEKLQYRILEPRLGFVGVRVPAGLNTPKVREDKIENHLIVRFFTWLKKQKHVEEILKVVVRDDSKSPCGDEVIERSLKDFNVRYLDWDREDLGSKVIEDTMEDIRGLWLYWSGNDAVLRGWADQNGLPRLEELKEVHLSVRQKWDSRERTEENLKDFKKQLSIEHLNKPTIIGGEMPQRHRGGVGKEGDPKPVVSTQTKANLWFANMGAFTEGIGDPSEESPQMAPVKVAIIDDGVDFYGPYKIEDGISFNQPRDPYNGPPEPFPSTLGHGTAMAKILHKVCPSARLYVAKLNETVGRRKFTMKYAAKAIQWAVDNDVHIISMSWTIDKAPDADIAALEKALKNAKQREIIMFCAARDEGREATDKLVYPYHAAPDAIIRIGATDQYGKERPYVPKEIDFLLPGVALSEQPIVLTNVPKEQLNSGEGSSEATALAAGVAALVIFCFGAIHGTAGINEVKGSSRMRKLFDEFSFGKDHFVHPELFQSAAEKAKVKKDVSDFGDKEIDRRMRNLIASCRGVLNAPRNANLKMGAHRHP